ncbi:hypothetical protein GF322_04295 [Candidatus Dependentiae bacterium]|nr:hypothetical protein [Candidatus Dependentiae bacterium]
MKNFYITWFFILVCISFFKINSQKFIAKIEPLDSNNSKSNNIFNEVVQESKENGLQDMNKKRISPQWKEKIAEQIDQDVQLIKQIILEGEPDKDEVRDFISLFKEQRYWLDKMITGTKYFFDPKYNALMQKKAALQRVAKAQEKADKFLKELVDSDGLEENVYKKLRLVILYDINSLIQNAIETGTANKFSTGISERKIKETAKDVFQDYKDKRAKSLIIENQVKLEIDKIENELVRIKHELEKQKLETELTEKKMIEKIENKNRIILELEMLLDKTMQNMEKLKKEEALRTKMQQDEKYRKIIEDKNKENLDLQLKLKTLQRKVSDLKNELQKYKTTNEE